VTEAPVWIALLSAGLTSALLVLALAQSVRHRSFVARVRQAAAEPPRPAPTATSRQWLSWALPPALVVACIGGTAWIYDDPPPWGAMLFWTLVTLGGVALWQATARRRRQQAIAMAFPDLVAHLSLQMQAGATPLQAFSSSLAVVHGPLGLELAVLVADLKLAPLDAALLRFADRAADPEIWAFCQHVVQQQRSGMSLEAIFAAEERHTLAMQHQRGRERISRAGAGLSAVLVILLLNGAALWALPMVLEFLAYLDPTQ
jgi:Flp pilus assembly protein TadB